MLAASSNSWAAKEQAKVGQKYGLFSVLDNKKNPPDKKHPTSKTSSLKCSDSRHYAFITWTSVNRVKRSTSNTPQANSFWECSRGLREDNHSTSLLNFLSGRLLYAVITSSTSPDAERYRPCGRNNFLASPGRVACCLDGC